MIARIRGQVLEQDDSGVVVDCAGVGYSVLVPVDEQSNLPAGSNADLYISEHIKEDTHDLFGFSARSRKALFDLLTSVNGIGPKAAMAILNIGTEAQVRAALASGDTKFICAAKGVGKKVAERAVVDLKNKVGLEASESATEFLGNAANTDEAVEALVALGYAAQDAAELLRGVDAKLPTDDRIRQALRSK